MENPTKISVQTNGKLQTDLQPVKKVKLYEHLTEEEINALIKKKQAEQKEEEP